jgi:hypothetical protein
MSYAHQSGKMGEETDETPLVLAGDKASAWELLLELHYDRSVGHKCSPLTQLTEY